MGELGLAEVLHRLDSLDKAVGANVERVADRVMSLDTKLDQIAESTSKLSGIVEGHITNEEMWRTEFSGRIHLCDVKADEASATAKRLVGTVESAFKKAEEAASVATLAATTKRDWSTRVSTAVAVVGFVVLLAGGLASYLKIRSDFAAVAPQIHHMAPAPSHTPRP